jgi:hypothetical protein
MAFVKEMFAENIPDRTKLSSPHDGHEELFAGLMEQFKMTLRDAEQIFPVLRNFVTLWDQKIQIELAALLPLLILAQNNHKAFAELKNGDFGAIKLLAEGQTKFRVTFKPRQRLNDREPRLESYNPLDFCVKFLFTAHNKLNDITVGGETGSSDSWISQRFATEFKVLHANMTYSDQEEARSLISQYREMVDQAIRFQHLGSSQQ